VNRNRNRTLAAALIGALTLAGTACGGNGATKASAAAPASATTTANGQQPAAANGQQPAGQFGDGNGDGPGDGGPGRGGFGGFGELDAAAKAIGVPTAELQTAVQNGQTIAQVAQAKGVPVDTVVASMVAAMKAHFDPEIASGEHTQAEVDQMMADATQRMTAIVNGQQPAGGPGFGGPGGGDGDHGAGDDDGGVQPSGGTGRKANTGKAA
jgi:hypothetical protein